MSKPVFLSHSSTDIEIVTQIRDDLESAQIPCWMAPRDIEPGLDYGSQIINAIEECTVLVLVLSEKSNESKFVRKEVERAIAKDKVVIPVRLEEVELSDSLEFFVSDAQWIDALDGADTRSLGLLKTAIQGHIGNRAPKTVERTEKQTADANTSSAAQASKNRPTQFLGNAQHPIFVPKLNTKVPLVGQVSPTAGKSKLRTSEPSGLFVLSSVMGTIIVLLIAIWLSLGVPSLRTPTETPTEVPTETPIETAAAVAPTEKPTEVTTTETSAETPTEMPTEMPEETTTQVPTSTPIAESQTITDNQADSSANESSMPSSSELTPTPIPIADSQRDFGPQGAGNWTYRIEKGRGSGDFSQQLDKFGLYPNNQPDAIQCWQPEREEHVRICETGEIHPSSNGRIAYQWKSNYTGTITLVVLSQKRDVTCMKSDGLDITVKHANQTFSRDIMEFTIVGDELHPKTPKTETINVKVGDDLTIMADIRGHSQCDEAELHIKIFG